MHMRDWEELQTPQDHKSGFCSLCLSARRAEGERSMEPTCGHQDAAFLLIFTLLFAIFALGFALACGAGAGAVFVSVSLSVCGGFVCAFELDRMFRCGADVGVALGIWLSLLLPSFVAAILPALFPSLLSPLHA